MAEKKSLTKLKKKIWHQIIAPPLFGDMVLGETLIETPQEMMNKHMYANLMNFVNDPKKQNTNLEFKVTRVSDNKGYAEVIGLKLTPSSIKRLVRRGYIKMEQTFPAQTQDGRAILVKTIMVISGACKSSVRAIIRAFTSQFIRKQMIKMTFDQFIGQVITNKLQKALQGQVRKIYPLRVCEIRRFILLEGEQASMIVKDLSEQPSEIKEEQQETAEEASEGEQEAQ